jgi:hypothetical protein
MGLGMHPFEALCIVTPACEEQINIGVPCNGASCLIGFVRAHSTLAHEKIPYLGSQEVCEDLTIPMTFILDFIDGWQLNILTSG